MDESIIQTIEHVLGWSGGRALGAVLAAMAVVASLVWFAWICLSQMPRLRAGEITGSNMLAEIARAFTVVVGTFAIVMILQLK